MNGVIERVKNNVLLKCSTLNDEIISKVLNQLIDKGVYHFAEDLISYVSGLNLDITEDTLRSKVNDTIKIPIIKKIKRKLFIDSLALQITNDSFIEKYVNKEITLEKLKKTYLKELRKNKSSNQLNMTEDLKLGEIIEKLQLLIDKEVIMYVKENTFLVNGINSIIDKTREELEQSLENMIDDTDSKYLEILSDELIAEVKFDEEEKIKEGEENMFENIEEYNYTSPVTDEVDNSKKFEKYDDMTLFNKVILSLNTKEEKLARKEAKLEQRKKEVDAILVDTNKNIEANIERENRLSQRKLELNAKEVELNSKLSEAEVIFLNMKPLIKGLNKIKVSEEGGNENE